MTALVVGAYIALGAMVTRRAFTVLVRHFKNEYPMLDFDAADLLFTALFAVCAGLFWPLVLAVAFAWPYLRAAADRIGADQ